MWALYALIPTDLRDRISSLFKGFCVNVTTFEIKLTWRYMSFKNSALIHNFLETSSFIVKSSIFDYFQTFGNFGLCLLQNVLNVLSVLLQFLISIRDLAGAIDWGRNVFPLFQLALCLWSINSLLFSHRSAQLNHLGLCYTTLHSQLLKNLINMVKPLANIQAAHSNLGLLTKEYRRF